MNDDPPFSLLRIKGGFRHQTVMPPRLLPGLSTATSTRNRCWISAAATVFGWTCYAMADDDTSKASGKTHTRCMISQSTPPRS